MLNMSTRWSRQCLIHKRQFNAGIEKPLTVRRTQYGQSLAFGTYSIRYFVTQLQRLATARWKAKSSRINSVWQYYFILKGWQITGQTKIHTRVWQFEQLYAVLSTIIFYSFLKQKQGLETRCPDKNFKSNAINDTITIRKKASVKYQLKMNDLFYLSQKFVSKLTADKRVIFSCSWNKVDHAAVFVLSVISSRRRYPGLPQWLQDYEAQFSHNSTFVTQIPTYVFFI